MSEKRASLTNGNFWYSSACHALYKFENEVLDLLASNLKEEYESNLQCFLLRRLKKGAIYVGSGNFSVMEFSLASNPKSPATCFYISLPCWEGTQVICCLFAPPDAHLELFRSELQEFCVTQVNKFKLESLDVKDIKGSVFEEEVNDWPHRAIDFLSRVVSTLGLNVAYSLQVALKAHTLEVTADTDPSLALDLRAFIMAASVAELLSSSSNASENIPHNVIMGADGVAQGLECSTYCQEWAKLIIKDPSSAASVKKVLESFKLKTIKDMNMLRRLLKQAETDHYSLYSACTFLRLSGNSGVLLHHAQEDGDSSKDVINILQQYLTSSTVK